MYNHICVCEGVLIGDNLRYGFFCCFFCFFMGTGGGFFFLIVVGGFCI